MARHSIAALLAFATLVSRNASAQSLEPIHVDRPARSAFVHIEAAVGLPPTPIVFLARDANDIEPPDPIRCTTPCTFVAPEGEYQVRAIIGSRVVRRPHRLHSGQNRLVIAPPPSRIPGWAVFIPGVVTFVGGLFVVMVGAVANTDCFDICYRPGDPYIAAGLIFAGVGIIDLFAGFGVLVSESVPWITEPARRWHARLRRPFIVPTFATSHDAQIFGAAVQF